MGRSPCCDELGVKKGPWTPEEDKKLVDYIQEHGHGSWRNLPKTAGLNRCGKSCRLRWTNYLRPDIKRGKFTEDEEKLIIHLHSILGNKWSSIATRLSGRTDNEIKNYWNTHLKKKLLLMGIDPVTHRRRTDLDILANLPNLLAAANLNSLAATTPWDNALRLQSDAAQLAKLQILQGLLQVMAPSTSPPPLNLDAMNLLGSASSASLGSHQLGDLFQLSRQLEAVLNGSLSLAQLPSGLQNLNNLQLPNSFQTFSGSSFSLDHEQEMVSQTRTEPLEESKGIDTFASVPAVNSTPALVSASPENVGPDDQILQEAVGSKDGSGPSSSASTPFEAWEGLNPTDLDNDLCWKDFLDQLTPWSNA